MARSMSRIQQISVVGLSPSVMTLRLLDIAVDGKCWSWSLATTGGLKCPDILASMSQLVTCVSIQRHSVNHPLANSIHYQFRKHLGMWLSGDTHFRLFPSNLRPLRPTNLRPSPSDDSPSVSVTPTYI